MSQVLTPPREEMVAATAAEMAVATAAEAEETPAAAEEEEIPAAAAEEEEIPGAAMETAVETQQVLMPAEMGMEIQVETRATTKALSLVPWVL